MGYVVRRMLRIELPAGGKRNAKEVVCGCTGYTEGGHASSWCDRGSWR